MPASTTSPSRRAATVATRVPSPPRTNASRAGCPATSIGRQACSRMLTVARSTCGASRKWRPSARRSPRSSRQVVRGEGVGRVLHRVGGDDQSSCRRRCGRPSKSPSRAMATVRSRSAVRASGRARPGRCGWRPCRSGSAPSSITPVLRLRSASHGGRWRCRRRRRARGAARRRGRRRARRPSRGAAPRAAGRRRRRSSGTRSGPRRRR